MAINRELSQFGRLVEIIDGEHIGIGTTSNVSIGFGTITATTLTVTTFNGSIANANYATTAGVSTYATTAGIATYSTTAGISTYSTTAGIATYATTAGIATNAQGLTGTPNITVGAVTATSFVKSGGTSSQFLKADGTVDTSTYLTTTGSAANLINITGASANTYGNSTTVPQLTVDTNGRITAISNITIAAAAPPPASQWTTNATGITTTSSVGIKSTEPTSALDVTGDVKVSGIVTATDFNSSSDINLKTNIQTIENPIDKLFEINGVTFNWIENEKASVGVIAQDVERALPQLVNDMGSHKVVNYNGLIGLLVECIKNQQKQIDELKALTENYNP